MESISCAFLILTITAVVERGGKVLSRVSTPLYIKGRGDDCDHSLTLHSALHIRAIHEPAVDDVVVTIIF